MRWSSAALLLLVGVAGCTASATVRRTTPVANLQSFRTLLVRVDGSPEARRYASVLAFHAADKLRAACAFDQVVTSRERPVRAPDLLLDLNLQRAFRGGEGLIQNPNLATIDVTLVLTDGVDDELLGSADIRGKSSAVYVANQNPEEQAIAAVSARVAQIMERSGCSGARVARPVPARPADDEPGPDGVDPETLARAEAENDAGKELFRAADIAGAKARFEAALALHRDARFLFNLCLAHEALKELARASTACQEVIDMQPEPRLAEKAKLRLGIIRDKRGG